MHLSSKHLLGIRELSSGDIQLILDTAKQFKDVLQRPIKKVPSLRDITVVGQQGLAQLTAGVGGEQVVERVVDVAVQKGVPVCRCSRHFARTYGAVGAGLVVHHHLLA